MPASVLKTPLENTAVNRAFRIGFAQVDNNQGGHANVRLNDAQQKLVMKVASVLGLSVQSVLNAGVLFALYCARQKKIRVEDLKEFPKRLTGAVIPLEISVETTAQIREAKVESAIGQCLVAGVRLLGSRLLD